MQTLEWWASLPRPRWGPKGLWGAGSETQNCGKLVLHRRRLEEGALLGRTWQLSQ